MGPITQTTRTFALSASVALCLVAGCGGAGAAFGPRFPDNDSGSIDDVTARLTASPPPSEPALVVGASSDPVGLFAYDLSSGRVLWQEASALGTVPHLAGDYVVTEEGDDAVVRRLTDGVITARVGRRGLRLVGAAGERGTGVLVLSTTAGAVAESSLITLADGATAHRYDVEQALGEPAVRAGMVFVPWGHQNVSVLDALTGAELTRVRVDEVIGHAVARGNDVFVGQRAMARFGSHLLSSPAWFEPGELERASGAALFDDAYAPPPNASSAAHHVRMALGPVASGSAPSGVDLEGGGLYEIFYRAIFALEGTEASARWATLTASDIVGVSVETHGVFVAEENGRISLLAPTDGRPLWTAETGVPSSYTTLRTAGFSPSMAPTGDALPLRDRLLTVAADTDSRLVPARAFAVRLLGQLTEPEVTANLIALCEDRHAAPTVHTAACETLSSRTVGGAAVLEALSRHAAFLQGTSAPPVGPLARAALAMGERSAVPLLLAQLGDPETPAADLPALFGALAGFGDTGALEPIAEWLRLYHAENDDSGLGDALAAAVRAYAALAGPTAADVLTPLVSDVATHALLREAAAAVLAPPPAEAGSEPPEGPSEGAPSSDAGPASGERSRARGRVHEAEASATISEPSPDAGIPSAGTVADVPGRVPPSSVPSAGGRVPPRPPSYPTPPAPLGRTPFESEEARERATFERAAREREVAAVEARSSDEDDRDWSAAGESHELPTHMTTAMVAAAVHEVRMELRRCLVTDHVTYGSARVVMLLEPTGAVVLVHAAPTELQSCVEPLMRSVPYPATRARRRQTVTYDIRR